MCKASVRPIVRLFSLSLLHFVTDALCAAVIFSKLYPVSNKSAVLVFLIYNLAAFVLQAPLGALLDRYNRPHLLIATSGSLLLLAVLLSSAPILSVTFLGIGNALLHVAGGKAVAVETHNDIASLGIFVSTGAIGLFIGQHFATTPLFSLLLLAIFAGAFSCLCLVSPAVGPTNRMDHTTIKSGALLLISVAAVVAIRAFVGRITTPDFALSANLTLFISLSTALGKALGGILCRFFKHCTVILVTMIAALILQVAGAGIPVLYFIGIMTFNCSMPITLHYTNRLLPGHEGFAFGALAALLIPGYFLALYISPALRGHLILFLTAATLMLLLLASRRLDQRHKEAP